MSPPPGRVTLKQALREYPGDVRSAAARVRDEWRKLTAPKYPRLRLPKEADHSSSSPEGQRARARLRSVYTFFMILCGGWIVVTVCVCAAVLLSPPSQDVVGLLAAFCLVSVVLTSECLYIGYAAYNLSRYGEWATTHVHP